MGKIEISDEEKALLKEYIKTTPLLLIRYKCQALLMRDKGLRLADIGDIVSRHGNTIGAWVTDWKERRMASIFTGHKDNQNASKLSKEQRRDIKKVLQKPPSEHTLPKRFWDVPSLKQYLKAQFGVVYESDRSYHFLLKFGNLSFKYPDTFDRRRDDAKVETRMEEIRKEIKPFLDDPEWEVFASDEVRIELEAQTRRAWLKKGERTIVKVDRKRESQNYLGFLDQKTYSCRLYEMAWQNQGEVLNAFKRLLRTYLGRKMCVVWDNAPFHKGKEIKNALKQGGLLERVHLVALPPYAPDKNPIEHVWNDAKGASANIQRDAFDDTKAAFAGHVRKRKFEYRI